eukprot:PITA_02531
MDEFITKFTSLLCYVPYIREEKAKVQRFVSSLPQTMRERIEFDSLKTMDEAIRKARICYQQNKQKGEKFGKRWTDKKGRRMTMGAKGARGSFSNGFSKGPSNRNQPKNQFKLRPPNESRYSEQSSRVDNEGTVRPPVQCWGCGGPHYIKNCPHRKGNDQVSRVYEASTVGDVAKSIPRINAALEDRQVDYQPMMVEFEVKIFDRTIFVLVDRGATLSYVSPKVVENCNLQYVKFKSPLVVQLATWAKRLEKRWSIINYKTKTISYQDELGNKQEIQDKVNTLESIPVVQEFADVFPKEIPGLPTKRDLDFTIELVPGAAPVSRAPYQMSVPELIELKMQLQELLDKKYIFPSVSPWGAPVLFFRKKDGTLRMA